ncbi:hypothetical protein RA876_02710 [Rhodoferax antarcticus]|nr:hypothetical protein RA876_02710 [Rhodoferax antarcticus]
MAWSENLPAGLNGLVVAPVRFRVHEDYELTAGSTTGCDATSRPCYCEFHSVQTHLRSDDDEVFYEVPVYAESRTSWRLLDGRWLVRQTTLNRLEPGGTNTHFFVTQTMPR